MNDYCEILRNSKTIAVVGISDKPGRDSSLIAQFLKSKGYIVVGVNPVMMKYNDIPIYKSLKEIPFEVDIVDIFRRSDLVEEVVDEAIEIKAKTVWMQLGVVNHSAAKKAENAGLKVVMDHCIAVEYRKCNS